MSIKALKNKAQSTLEYIGVILTIVAALIVAGVYYQRNLQEKYRQAGDVLGDGSQYTVHR